MSQSPSTNSIVAACPSCGKTYPLPADRIGHKARCGACKTVFEIRAREPEVAAVAAGHSPLPQPSTPPPAVPSVSRIDPGVGVCPVCRTAADDAQVECPDCHARHHQECWDYNGGCGKYGCPSAPEPKKIDDLEVPLAYWGKTDKECPSCRNVIQAAALRCRHCGMVFSTAKPQATGEFREQQALESDLPGLRRKGIWLLVFSVLPCTTTITLLVGGLWYAANRKRLAALPAQQAAIPKIGLIIGTVQTVLLVVVLVLYQFRGP